MKISIITPCLNSAKTIRQTIESVLNQTYHNIEYIIVDGASMDGTLEIIQEYEPQFQGRLHYVSEPDHGIYDAMNKGIRMSHGMFDGCHCVGILRRSHHNLPQEMIPHPACFLTRSIYKKFGLFLNVFKIAGDYELMLRLYKSNRVKFVQIHSVIANFRMGGISSSSRQLKRERAWILFRYKFISFIKMIEQMV